MTSKIMLKVAGPMVALSLLLLAVGILAAVNVQKQQRAHAELVASEVNSMLAAEDISSRCAMSVGNSICIFAPTIRSICAVFID